jgi:hypothetical protein
MFWVGGGNDAEPKGIHWEIFDGIV